MLFCSSSASLRLHLNAPAITRWKLMWMITRIFITNINLTFKCFWQEDSNHYAKFHVSNFYVYPATFWKNNNFALMCPLTYKIVPAPYYCFLTWVISECDLKLLDELRRFFSKRDVHFYLQQRLNGLTCLTNLTILGQMVLGDGRCHYCKYFWMHIHMS